jgi:hypothetical protein
MDIGSPAAFAVGINLPAIPTRSDKPDLPVSAGIVKLARWFTAGRSQQGRIHLSKPKNARKRTKLPTDLPRLIGLDPPAAFAGDASPAIPTRLDLSDLPASAGIAKLARWFTAGRSQQGRIHLSKPKNARRRAKPPADLSRLMGIDSPVAFAGE